MNRTSIGNSPASCYRIRRMRRAHKATKRPQRITSTERTSLDPFLTWITATALIHIIISTILSA